jgi:hypothetical protein
MIPINFLDLPSREHVSDPGLAKPVIGSLDRTRIPSPQIQ